MAGLYHAVVAVFIFSGAAGVQAEPSPDFWDRVTDAYLNTLLVEGDPEKFDAMLRTEGRTVSEGEHGGDTYFFEDGRATLRLYAANAVGRILGGYMSWSGDADTRIPPLSITFGTTGRFTHRSDLTLGSTACSCRSPAQASTLNGTPVALLTCYLGRGGGYLNYALVYPDPDKKIVALMGGTGEAGVASVCMASDRFRNNPRILEHMGIDLQQIVPAVIDVEVKPVAVLHWDSDRASMEDILMLTLSSISTSGRSD